MREQLAFSTRLCTARAGRFPGVVMRLVGRHPSVLGVLMRYTAQLIPSGLHPRHGLINRSLSCA